MRSFANAKNSYQKLPPGKPRQPRMQGDETKPRLLKHGGCTFHMRLKSTVLSTRYSNKILKNTWSKVSKGTIRKHILFPTSFSTTSYSSLNLPNLYSYRPLMEIWWSCIWFIKQWFKGRLILFSSSGPILESHLPGFENCPSKYPLVYEKCSSNQKVPSLW